MNTRKQVIQDETSAIVHTLNPEMFGSHVEFNVAVKIKMDNRVNKNV